MRVGTSYLRGLSNQELQDEYSVTAEAVGKHLDIIREATQGLESLQRSMPGEWDAHADESFRRIVAAREQLQRINKDFALPEEEELKRREIF